MDVRTDPFFELLNVRSDKNGRFRYQNGFWQIGKIPGICHSTLKQLIYQLPEGPFFSSPPHIDLVLGPLHTGKPTSELLEYVE
jgi:hypothetical protein